jgi:Golgi SNAP receptor complex protein 2
VYSLRTSFTRAQSHNPHSSYSQQSAAAATRRELFERSASSSDAGARAEMDAHVREGDALGRSHRAIDDMSTMGNSALASLRTQRATLKSAHRKAMDMVNTMGLSQSIMKLIGREEHISAWITYAGMIVTLGVVAGIWYFIRR